MANIKSAQKAIRVTKRRTIINKRIREDYREVKREIRRNIEQKDVAAATKLLPKYQSKLDIAVKKGVIKKNTASRYKSRMVKMLKLQS